MVPIDFFIQLSTICATRPFALLPADQQQFFITESKKITQGLKDTLEQKKLTDTQAYRIVMLMHSAVSDAEFDEVRFADGASQLDLLYGGQGKKPKPRVEELDRFAERFKNRAHAFSVLESQALNAASELSPQQIADHDKKAMQEVGSFYVLEYTLTIEQQMYKTDEAGKQALLNDGLSTDVGNLPGLLPLVESLRQEFAFHMYNTDTRWALLRLFFDFEDATTQQDLPHTLHALRQLNLGILKLMISTGLTHFSGVLYKPYNDNTSLEDIVSSLP